MKALGKKQFDVAGFTKIVVFLIPVALTAAFFWIKENEKKKYKVLIREDGLIEYLTFFSYLLAFLITLFVVRIFWANRSRRTVILFSLLALGFLFVAGEEISWGQRLLNIRPAELFQKHSIQREMNIHNLEHVHLHMNNLFILVATYGAFGWFARILVDRTRWPESKRKLVKLILPRWYLAGYFLPALLFFVYIEYLFPKVYLFGIRFKEQEPAEFILGLGFLFYMITVLCLQVREKSSSQGLLMGRGAGSQNRAK